MMGLGGQFFKGPACFFYVAHWGQRRFVPAGSRRWRLGWNAWNTTWQAARQTPIHAGCAQTGCAHACASWHRSRGAGLRRARRGLADSSCNAILGEINRRVLKVDGA